MASNFIIKYKSYKRRPYKDKDKDLSYVVTNRAMACFWKLGTKKETPWKMLWGTCQHLNSTRQASNAVRESVWVVCTLQGFLSCWSISIKLLMVARLLCKILSHRYANYQTGRELSLNRVSCGWYIQPRNITFSVITSSGPFIYGMISSCLFIVNASPEILRASFKNRSLIISR